MKRKIPIEIFTEGCQSCGGWLAYGQQLSSSNENYELYVWAAGDEANAERREEKMTLYRIDELPAIVIDGELLTCCTAEGGIK